MDTQFSLRDMVYDFLAENHDIKFTANEISKGIIEKYPEYGKRIETSACKAIKDKKGVINYLGGKARQAIERIQKGSDKVKTEIIASRSGGKETRRYYYSPLSEENIVYIKNKPLVENCYINNDAVKQSEKFIRNNSYNISEYDLYPIFGKYLINILKIRCKRIDEKKSRKGKAGTNKWRHPDLVGMEVLQTEWNKEPTVRLWSFEVKNRIGISDANDCFFQTLKNSSWANLGYLAASEFESEETLKELERLSNRHGIGVIKIDKENPFKSKILMEAKANKIDWEDADRLAKINTDFFDYIKNVRNYYATGLINKADWM